MKAIIFVSSIVSTIVLFFYLFASNDNGLAYKIASRIIGKAPQDGDGAFQFPLGWLILVILGSAIGWLIGYLVVKCFVKT